MKSVYSAVRTGSLNNAVLQHKMVGFYNTDEIFYSAVRTWALNSTDYLSFLNGYYGALLQQH